VIAAAFLMVLEDASFIDILFEAVSCFSTAGMSTGITPVSHDITKALFMITMFFGRVGPLSFAIALSIKANRKDADMVYPEGKIMVG
jgi:trk system potassium uptake protein TrkH